MDQQPRYFTRLTAGRAVGQSFSLVFRNFAVVSAIALLLLAFPALLAALIPEWMMRDTAPSLGMLSEQWLERLPGGDWSLGEAEAFLADTMGPLLKAAGIQVLLSALIGILATPVANGALLIVYSRAAIEKKTDFGLALRFAFQRFGQLIGLALCWVLVDLVVALGLIAVMFFAIVLVTLLAMAGGFGLLIAVPLMLALAGAAVIGGVALIAARAMSFAAAMNEGIWGFAAVKRGFSLLKQRFWGCVGANMLISLCVTGVAIIPNIAVSVGTLLSGSTLPATLVSALVTAVLTALQLALASRFYFAIRAEREGWQPMLVEEGGHEPV